MANKKVNKNLKILKILLYLLKFLEWHDMMHLEYISGVIAENINGGKTK